jgi:hypothetical protein
MSSAKVSEILSPTSAVLELSSEANCNGSAVPCGIMAFPFESVETRGTDVCGCAFVAPAWFGVPMMYNAEARRLRTAPGAIAIAFNVVVE